MQESTKKKEEAGDVLQLVGFQIGDEEFGVEILKVQEINRMPEISPIPNAEEYIKGVINLRGAVIPVLSRSANGWGWRRSTTTTKRA